MCYHKGHFILGIGLKEKFYISHKEELFASKPYASETSTEKVMKR